MASIEIDGKDYQLESGDNLLEGVLSLGLNLPYFCWHPAMGSVGACRQCAIIQYHDKDDDQGRLVMACMTPVTEGMRISVEAPEVREFRGDILELLMTNHPHDCPVCEEGGECHLQDMTVMTGHTVRIYRGKKRTHRNQYLGPFISHEMNRCIACYRCVRFYQDYAGGSDLDVFGAHNDVFFGRHEEGTLENEFSGNLVEVCPTGVFTDKTLSQCYSRKWDIQAAPSVCTHCSLGCNTSVGERYGELRRIVNRYNGEVNGYFLCDRGRFGYGFVNHEQRLRKPLIENQPTVSKQAALKHFESLVKDRTKVVGVGSPRASVENNYALRELVGPENFYLGFGESEYAVISLVVELLQNPPAKIPTLKEIEQCDAVLVLGEDVTNTAPRLALSIRQSGRNVSFEIADSLYIPRWQDAAVREAAQQERNPLIVACHHETKLDDIATEIFRGDATGIARLGFAIAHELDLDAPAVDGMTEDEVVQAKSIAALLSQAKNPLIVTGTGCQNASVVQAAANISKAISSDQKAFFPVVPESNSIGLALIGGKQFLDSAKRIQTDSIQTVVVLENDLYRRGDKLSIDKFLEAIPHVVVIDHFVHATARRSELVLPAATFAEEEGTLVSAEGRAQRYFPVLLPSDDIQSSWHWLHELGVGADWGQLDDVTAACSTALPQLKSIADAAPSAKFRISGMKIPRQSHRYSGRTAMLADINVSEPKQPEDKDSALSFSMEGIESNRPPALNPGVWAPAWNSNQAVNKFQDEIGGSLRGGDPGVRLFEVNGGMPSWYSSVPKRSKNSPSKFVCVPVYHIFGSDELSTFSSSLAERIPSPYLGLNVEHAQTLLVGNDDEVEVIFSGSSLRFPIKVMSGLATKTVGVPVGLPGIETPPAGSIVTIKKVV